MTVLLKSIFDKIFWQISVEKDVFIFEILMFLSEFFDPSVVIIVTQFWNSTDENLICFNHIIISKIHVPSSFLGEKQFLHLE